MRFDADLKKYRGHRAYLEFVDPGPGYYEIDEIRFADPAGPKENPIAEAPPVTSGNRALLEEGRRLARSLPPERFALTMAEGTPENARVYVRGSYRSPGEEVPRRFLTALGARRAVASLSPRKPSHGESAHLARRREPDSGITFRTRNCRERR